MKSNEEALHIRKNLSIRVQEKLKTNANDMVEIPIVLTNNDTTSSDLEQLLGNNVFSNHYERLTVCTHLKLRALRCKYRLGKSPTNKEKQDILAIRRELIKNDSFLLVDELDEEGQEGKQNADMSVSNSQLSQTLTTIIIKFPLFLIMFFVIATYDVIFDSQFRNQITQLVRWDRKSRDI